MSPFKLLNNLGSISPNLRQYAQEDAHEFLRLLIDAMQGCCDDRNKTLPISTPLSSSSSSLNIRPYPFTSFDGTLQSSVTCSVCGTVSNTFDPTEDLGTVYFSPYTSIHSLLIPSSSFFKIYTC